MDNNEFNLKLTVGQYTNAVWHEVVAAASKELCRTPPYTKDVSLVSLGVLTNLDFQAQLVGLGLTESQIDLFHDCFLGSPSIIEGLWDKLALIQEINSECVRYMVRHRSLQALREAVADSVLCGEDNGLSREAVYDGLIFRVNYVRFALHRTTEWLVKFFENPSDSDALKNLWFRERLDPEAYHMSLIQGLRAGVFRTGSTPSPGGFEEL